MKLGLSIRWCAAIVGFFAVGTASACSCRHIEAENLVRDKQLSLARIAVMPPTFTERIASLLAFFEESRTYRVRVIEVITGQYDATVIEVLSSGPAACGIELRPGKTYYHRTGPAVAGKPLQASVCNFVDEGYVRQVKAYTQ